MESLTTRLQPRDYLAVKKISARCNMTPSEWVRNLIEGNVEVRTEPVKEDDIELLNRKSKVKMEKKRKRWFKFW